MEYKTLNFKIQNFNYLGAFIINKNTFMLLFKSLYDVFNEFKENENEE